MSRRSLPPPATDDVLSRRFSINREAPSPQPSHTSHTPHTAVTSQRPVQQAAPQRRGEPPGMVRRTYYFSERVADELAAAVARLHYGSHGRVSKAAALDAIIAAGLEHLDAIEQRLRSEA